MIDLFSLYNVMKFSHIKIFCKNGENIYNGPFEKVPLGLAYTRVISIVPEYSLNLINIKIDLQENLIKNVFISDLYKMQGGQEDKNV